jgi:hypothetical protein
MVVYAFLNARAQQKFAVIPAKLAQDQLVVMVCSPLRTPRRTAGSHVPWVHIRGHDKGDATYYETSKMAITCKV